MKYKLYHYSEKPFTISSSHFYKKNSGMKPNGLWVSVGEDWEKWCRKEDFYIEALRYKTEIKLKDASKILYVRTQKDLDIIEKNYERLISSPAPSFLSLMYSVTPYFYTCDWKKMKEDYSGIILDEDTEDLRNNGFRNGGVSDWIETWDCLSGCIWDFDIIEVEKTIRL